MKLLSPRQLAFCSHYVAGKSARDAARLAGYAAGYVRHADKITSNPKIAAEIARHRETLREKTGYDAAAAMAELDRSILFARETENANALAKLIELKMKLHGLLIERIDQRGVGNFSINISGIDDEPAPQAPAVERPPAVSAPGNNGMLSLLEIGSTEK